MHDKKMNTTTKALGRTITVIINLIHRNPAFSSSKTPSHITIDITRNAC